MPAFDASYFAMAHWAVLTLLLVSMLSVWALCRKPRCLLWLAAALGLYGLAGWLSSRAEATEGLPVALASSGLLLLAAVAMAQASASRMGQNRHFVWVVAALTAVVITVSISMGRSSAGVTAWACACVLGQGLVALWRTPVRNGYERGMLVAHTACASGLLAMAALAWWQGQAAMVALWWVLELMLLAYSVALLAATWMDVPHQLRTAQSADTLTGLLPRVALEAACGPQPYVRGMRVLILCDLDQLQRVYNQYGRTAGDDLLRCFAHILQTNVREGDCVGRLSEDEFVIALRHIDLASAKALAVRINEQLARARWAQKGPSGPVTASFGIAAIEEEDSFDAALHRADVLLYQAKDSGANGIWVQTLQASPLQSAPY